MCAVGPRELLATSILPFVVRGGGLSASGLRALGVTMASHLPPQCDYCRDSADVAAVAMHAGAVLRVPAGAPASPQEVRIDGTTFPAQGVSCLAAAWCDCQAEPGRAFTCPLTRAFPREGSVELC